MNQINILIWCLIVIFIAFLGYYFYEKGQLIVRENMVPQSTVVPESTVIPNQPGFGGGGIYVPPSGGNPFGPPKPPPMRPKPPQRPPQRKKTPPPPKPSISQKDATPFRIYHNVTGAKTYISKTLNQSQFQGTLSYNDAQSFFLGSVKLNNQTYNILTQSPDKIYYIRLDGTSLIPTLYESESSPFQAISNLSASDTEKQLGSIQAISSISNNMPLFVYNNSSNNTIQYYAETVAPAPATVPVTVPAPAPATVPVTVPAPATVPATAPATAPAPATVPSQHNSDTHTNNQKNNYSKEDDDKINVHFSEYVYTI